MYIAIWEHNNCDAVAYPFSDIITALATIKKKVLDCFNIELKDEKLTSDMRIEHWQYYGVYPKGRVHIIKSELDGVLYAEGSSTS